VEPPQLVYKQSATHLALPLYLRPDMEVDGRFIVDLAEAFLSSLVFPGCRPTALHTKRAGEGAKLNMGEFTATRWKSSVAKILNREYAVVDIRVETPDFPNQKIWFSTHFNPVGGDEFLISGTVEVKCSVSYLRHLAASPEKIEALIHLAKQAWNGIDGGPAYGYGNLAITLARPVFDPRMPMPPGAPLPWEFIKPPEKRPHAVPIAYVGNDIEGNLSSLYCGGRGIKGAFWANFLSAGYVEIAGGEKTIRAKLAGLRIDALDHGGLLIVVTDSPLPEDTPETRDRFGRLHSALQPAFLSREQISENKRSMLGYFYRERAYQGES
jgi:hypothetical protein